MASIRARLSRRVALRRAVPAEDVDIEQVQLFWGRLSCEERCTVLRFTDKALVQRLHSHMSALCHADLWRGANGMRDAAAPERLRGFGFERSAETLCLSRSQGPIAFCATEDLAGRDDIFDELAEQLGSRFLQGRPALSDKDWLTVVEDLPDSWRGLQLQALRLVELAIFQAHREARVEASAAQEDEASLHVGPEASQQSSGAPAAAAEAAAQGGLPAPLSQSAKRRARKKQQQQQQQQQEQEEEEKQRQQEEQEQHSMTAAAPQAASGQTATTTSMEGSGEEPGQEGHTGHRGDAPEHGVPEPVAREPSELPSGSTLSATWFSWFPSLQKDGTAEWQCRTSSQSRGGAAGATAAGFRAFVKNTFLHIEPLQSVGVEESQHRSRKCRSSKF